MWVRLFKATGERHLQLTVWLTYITFSGYLVKPASEPSHLPASIATGSSLLPRPALLRWTFPTPSAIWNPPHPHNQPLLHPGFPGPPHPLLWH